MPGGLVMAAPDAPGAHHHLGASPADSGMMLDSEPPHSAAPALPGALVAARSHGCSTSHMVAGEAADAPSSLSHDPPFPKAALLAPAADFDLYPGMMRRFMNTW